MADLALENRVTTLEEMMAVLTQEVTRFAQGVEAFKEEVRLDREKNAAEMRQFKEEMRLEMRQFREEMRLGREKSEADWQAFREKSEADWQAFQKKSEADWQAFQKKSEADFQQYRREWRAEAQAAREKSEADFQQYRREWRAELQADKEKSEADFQQYRREWNRQYGDLANKMGTLVEDLVAPSLPRILGEVVTCPAAEAVSMAVRVRRVHSTDRGRMQEWDAIVSCGRYALFNETKATLRPEDIDALIRKLSQARDYFPEYQDYKLIGAVASLYIDPNYVPYATRQGVLALATGYELMDILNEPGFQVREF